MYRSGQPYVDNADGKLCLAVEEVGDVPPKVLHPLTFMSFPPDIGQDLPLGKRVAAVGVLFYYYYFFAQYI